jgi:hypothetical protein
MGARLRVFLTRDQDKTLLNLRTADAPRKVKDRAEIIRLNAHGWYVEKIAAHFNWTPQTVREVLHKWKKLGMQGLWDKPGRGGNCIVTAFITAKAVLALLGKLIILLGAFGWVIAGIIASITTAILGMGWLFYCDDFYRHSNC